MSRIAFAFFLLLALAASAQDSLYKFKIGVEIAGVKTRYNFLSYYPSLTCSFGRHSVFAGPGMYYLDSDQPKPFVGIQAGYQCELTGTENVKLFVGYDFNFVQGRSIHNFIFQGDKDGVRQRTIDMVSLDNYFSAGLRATFGRFYMKTLMGLGFGLYKQDFTYHFYNNQTLSATGPLTYRYPAGLILIAKVSVGVNLIRVKRKPLSAAKKQA